MNKYIVYINVKMKELINNLYFILRNLKLQHWFTYLVPVDNEKNCSDYPFDAFLQSIVPHHSLDLDYHMLEIFVYFHLHK